MRKIALALAVLLLIQQSLAQDYYADLEIDVDNEDFVTIKGDTDHPSLLTKDTEQYISKESGVRTLKIETAEAFSEYFITLNLPRGTSINYAKSSGPFRIESNLGKLSLITFAENEPISITIQYQIQKTSTKILYYLPFALALILIIYTVKKLSRQLKPKIPKEKKAEPNLKGLTSRQKDIMKLLIEKDKPLTQTEIEEELKLPKSSVSRNIHTLEMKGLIEKEKIGMSNKICIKKS